VNGLVKQKPSFQFFESLSLLFHPQISSPMHCAKSHRPFELFANENHKLWNEAEMNATFERGSARDPRRGPLSAELNDASA